MSSPFLFSRISPATSFPWVMPKQSGSTIDDRHCTRYAPEFQPRRYCDHSVVRNLEGKSPADFRPRPRPRPRAPELPVLPILPVLPGLPAAAAPYHTTKPYYWRAQADGRPRRLLPRTRRRRRVYQPDSRFCSLYARSATPRGRLPVLCPPFTAGSAPPSPRPAPCHLPSPVTRPLSPALLLFHLFTGRTLFP